MAKTRSGKKSNGSPPKSKKRSSVKLRGTKEATAAKNVKQKISKVETEIEEANAEIDKEEQRRLDAKKILDDVQSRLPGKRAQLKERIEEVKQVKKDRKVLSGFKNVYDHLEMGDSGGSYDTLELRNNKNVLRIDDKEAPLGMRLTERLEMKPNEVAKAEYYARRRASHGGEVLNTWGYTLTGDNNSIMQAARHAMGSGLSEHNEKKKKNVLVDFPAMARSYSFINITDEGEGVEIHAPGDDIPITMDKMLDKVAHYMRFKDFRNLRQYLTGVGGMYMEKFIGDEIVSYKGPSDPNFPRYKSASIRFKFNAGNGKRFETH